MSVPERRTFRPLLPTVLLMLLGRRCLGASASAGVYFVRLTTPVGTKTRRLVLAR